MQIIASAGGSGSSFVATELANKGYNVVVRPDSGYQKPGRDPVEIARKRCAGLCVIPNHDHTPRELFDEVYTGLIRRNVVLLSMTWGGLGYLDDLPVIWLVRHPVHAFNSFSGGGWRHEGGRRRFESFGCETANDRRWIDAFLGDFSHWIAMAESAVASVSAGQGEIVRYHRFAEDWPEAHVGDGTPDLLGV